MKIALFLMSLTFASFAFAEVKVRGTFVASECSTGKQNLTVCFGNVVGSDANFVQFRFGRETKEVYFIAKSKVINKDARYLTTEYLLKNKVGDTIVASSKFDGSTWTTVWMGGKFSNGAPFSVRNFQQVFHTQSVK